MGSSLGSRAMEPDRERSRLCASVSRRACLSASARASSSSSSCVSLSNHCCSASASG